MTEAKLPTVYQEFIALSRYARFNQELGRRETWEETVDRLIDFWEKKYSEIMSSPLSEEKPQPIATYLREAILNLEVMPSMRTLMTAGPALERDNIAGYNCSAAAITGSGPVVELWNDKLNELGYEDPIKVTLRSPTVFDELLYILLCGTGVGFSVERQFINEMPTVGRLLSRSIYKRTKMNYPGVNKNDLSYFHKQSNTIYVADSKYGWASALRILLVEFYNGNFDIKYDLSDIRSAGSVLKTFGGRASGPEPLANLFESARKIFKEADGRKLTSIECHDLMCHIASAVVIGGVRRASLISLSNLTDERMRYAKSGQWWNESPQRSIANNSVAYTEKPDIGAFMREWQVLYESKSGERGIFNRDGVKKAAESINRDTNHEFLTNPCVVGNTSILTSKGNFLIKDVVGEEVEIWNGFEWSKVIPFSTGENELMEIMVSNGVWLTCTLYHKFILDSGKKIEARYLKLGDRLKAFSLPRTKKGHPIVDAPSKKDRRKLVVQNITFLNKKEETFCFTDKLRGLGTFNGIVTGNCGEILLRHTGQLCNLTTIILRKNDLLQDLKDKVELATILGTLQSSLTDFVYLPKKWKDNCEDERLLGVSMCGPCDHEILSNVSDEAKEWLEELREYARNVNKKWAKILKINASKSITCNKPEGTTSQLVDSASGLHPRYSEHYIRRVRADDKDPLAIVMKEQGYPCEVVEGQSSQWVFSFPIKSPDNAVFRDDRTAIEQLEYWLMWKEYWCDHNPSVTIYVKEHEWVEVGAWVYNNFDKICGVSFLPHTDHIYKQAPYEECTKEVYEDLLSKMPKGIDYDKLRKIESEDYTTGMQEYACSAGVCELV